MKNKWMISIIRGVFWIYLLTGLNTQLQAQWENVGNAGFSAGTADRQSLAFHPATHEPYVAFRDGGNISKTTVMKFNGTAWENVGNTGFSAGTASYISLAFHPTTHEPYVAYEDGGSGLKTTVMKFNGTTWENVGIAGFSAGRAIEQSLAFHPTSHEPYVAYQDQANSNKCTVMKLNGSTWENVGNAGFSAGGMGTPSLAFHPTTQEPYVAYRDDVNAASNTVMKFNGTTWEIVGTAGFTTGIALEQSLAFHPTTHEPYLAYADLNSFFKTTVSKFNGTTWEVVGTAGFTAGAGNIPSLAFHPDTHEPYVAYKDGGNSSKTSVMKFNGTAWELVGTAGFSAGTTDFTKLAFHPDTFEPYVTYKDQVNGNKTTVMKFPTPEINIKVGTNEFASGGTYNFNNINVNASSADMSFSIVNKGTANLTLSGAAGALVVLGGTNADQFSVVQTGVTSPIAGRTTQNFTVKFSPTSTGEKTATLTITNNDSNEGTYTINLKGTGEAIPAPTITSFSPTSGVEGTTVTITGTNFDATAANNIVKFNGTTATVTSATTTELKVTVPTGATTGKITVEVNGQTATGTTDFVVKPPLTITDFTPKTGKGGYGVIITGTNFDTTTTNNAVKFNGTSAFVTSATLTELKVTAPATVTTGKITVEVNGKTATSAVDFVVIPTPTITDFTPKTGKTGDEVTITGTNFDATVANNIVKFNGTTAMVTSATTTELKVTVPNGVTTGKITVEVNGQTVITSDSFTVETSPTGLPKNLQNGKLTLFPNPVKSVLKLKFEGKVVQQVNLIVYNALGTPMLKTTQQLQNGEVTLNLAGLPSGKYMLKIQVGDEVISRSIWKK